jgi:hypothetical protein
MTNKIVIVKTLKQFLTLFTISAQVPSYVPTNGLVGYWPFNGNANDLSVNANNGTVNGATLTTDRNGNANSAYSFNGSSGISIPHSTSLNIASSSTFSFWLKYNSLSNCFNLVFNCFSLVFIILPSEVFFKTVSPYIMESFEECPILIVTKSYRYMEEI